MTGRTPSTSRRDADLCRATDGAAGAYPAALLALAAGLAVAALLALPVPGQAQERAAEEREPPLPEPADLLTFVEPQAVEISPDGERALVPSRRARIDENRWQEKVWLVEVGGGSDARELSLREGADDLTWGPEGERVAYLAPDDSGPPQVWLQRPGADSARQVTRHEGGVTGFSFSPDGEALAFTALGPRPEFEARSDSAREGITVDPRTFVLYRLFGNRIFSEGQRTRELWVRRLDRDSARQVTERHSVQGYAWAPDGGRLAVSAAPESGVLTPTADLLLYRLDGDELRMLREGEDGEPRVFDGATSYEDPFWSPSGERLGFLKTDHTDRWSAVDRLGVLEVATGEARWLTAPDRQAFYAADFHWLAPGRILLANTSDARRGLWEIAVDDGTIEPVRVTDRYAEGHSFDADGQRAVWIEQSIGRPPELYAAEAPFEEARRVTSFNDGHGETWSPEVESVTWTSADGTEVQGWLVHAREGARSGPDPLLVVVHGGPGYAVTNRYHPYPAWLYPVQVFAARGYTVFLPNYRGTGSFGKAFQEPDSNAREPVEDVLTGIEHLVATREIDRERIGILGQSHGAWLGPMVVAEDPRFAAASFAEGAGDKLSLYGQMPGLLNRNIHEHFMGTTPYEDPEAYLRESPVFLESFTGTTPTLLEYGQESLAVQGLEYASALWRQGTPHELVIYPGTGHNISEPALHLDSMERNLRWFRRWLLEDEGSGGADGDAER